MEHIVYEHSHGGRLRYLRQKADSRYWDELWGRTNVSYDRALKGHLPWHLRTCLKGVLRPDLKVLEAGCGLAHFTISMSARGHSAHGIDWAPEVISRLRAQFPRIAFTTGDARALKFADQSFDLVYSPGVCEHFEDGPESVLMECFRVLRPGGFLAVSTPILNSLRAYLVRRGHFVAPPSGHDLEFYQFAFNPEFMRTTLVKLGFEISRSVSVGALKTMMDHLPTARHVPSRLRRPIAFALDHLPITNSWGHSCVWLARRP